MVNDFGNGPLPRLTGIHATDQRRMSEKAKEEEKKERNTYLGTIPSFNQFCTYEYRLDE